MQKQRTAKKTATAPKTQWVGKARKMLADALLRVIYGRKMHISAQAPSPIAGAVAFWYMDHNVKHFIFAKDNENKSLRFPSCLGLKNHNSISAALKDTINELFGNAFMKAFDSKLLGMENLTTVPVFSYLDQVGQAALPVHTLVWQIQITPEQAQLCQPQQAGTDVIAVPEGSLSNQNVAPSHVTILAEIQKVNRKAQQRMMKETNVSSDVLDDLLKGNIGSSRTIH